ncbi:glycoside hydrolase family 20 zincin-like fold domain-containing protein [Paenibacillus cremeus]|uniref:Beta-hexosaminidase bacterial type N-terminal domain-containing protein n=1 Tax=Paenibacillus cremeus TaxID=2163881 RepID=A0A559KGA6_9BACL|nr:hypothetical protein [Paenibacillus cremeus]TVY11167.1 hypothetical protein FPZ49_04865 [Paenibacillus cremeus]
MNQQQVCNGVQVTDISSASIYISASMPARGRTAVNILVEEIEKRTGIRLPVLDTPPADTRPVIAVHYLTEQGQNAPGPEGFRISTESRERFTITVEGADDRGVLYGVGKLLRLMYMTESHLQAPSSISLCETPHFPLRGHQLGYRPKTNAYDAWTPEIYSQYIRELALFGANSIEIMPPITDDDRTGPLMIYDPLFMMQHVSEVCDSMDLDVWIWYPNMGSEDNWYPASGNDEEFMKPDYLKLQLDERDEIFGSMKRVDHVFVPGGDPGALGAQDLFDFMAMQAEVLHKHHPHAQLWVSPQAFNPTDEWLNVFFENVRKEPEWLSGVVFGPWEKHSLPELRQLVPERIAIRSYPDITHSLSCQYPVPNWDTAFAMTLSRECINPRPVAQKHIHNSTKDDGIVGSLSYSEGINDDVNKFVWSGQDWNPETPVLDTLKEFARLFIGPQFEAGVSQGLLALERNFDGPIATSHQIPVTLQQWKAMEAIADEKVQNNYRFEQGLLRAYYDAYIQRRWIHEAELESKARDILAQAPSLGTLQAMELAEEMLDKKETEPVCAEYKLKCDDLADRLFEHIGAQLTVERHKAIGVIRGAFMDGIDLPLNDMAFLKDAFAIIRQLPTEQERLNALNDKIIHRTNPGIGGIYDNFALNHSISRVEHIHSWADDPGYLKTPLLRHNPAILQKALATSSTSTYTRLIKETLDRILPGLSSPPLAWVTYLNSYYSAPIKVTYTDLDPYASYVVKVMGLWGGRVRMLVNGKYADDTDVKYRGLLDEYPITPDQIPDGRLEIVWVNEESGVGPYINELWIIKQ